MLKSTQKSLLSSFKEPSLMNPGWFMVHDEKVNDRLTSSFGLFVDAPIFSENGFDFKFNWASEQWLVR